MNLRDALFTGAMICSLSFSTPLAAFAKTMPSNSQTSVVKIADVSDEETTVDPLEVDFENHTKYSNFYPYYVKPGEKTNLYFTIPAEFYSRGDEYTSDSDADIQVELPGTQDYSMTLEFDLGEFKPAGEVVTEGLKSAKVTVSGNKVTVFIEHAPDKDNAEKFSFALPVTVPDKVGKYEVGLTYSAKAENFEVGAVPMRIPMEVVDTLPENLEGPYTGFQDMMRSDWTLAYMLYIGIINAFVNEDDYTAPSWAKYQDCIAEVDAVVNDPDATLDDFKDVLNGFSDKALAALVEKPATDEEKEALNKLMGEVDSLKEGDYTPDSWKSFQEKLAGVKENLAKPRAGSLTYRNAVNAIEMAMEFLHPASTTDKDNSDAPTRPGDETTSDTDKNQTGGSDLSSTEDDGSENKETSGSNTNNNAGSGAGNTNDNTNTGSGTGNTSGNTNANSGAGNTSGTTNTTTSPSPTQTTTQTQVPSTSASSSPYSSTLSSSSSTATKMPQTSTQAIVLPLALGGLAAVAALGVKQAMRKDN